MSIRRVFILSLAVLIPALFGFDSAHAIPVLNPDNGHFYEAIEGELNWLEAKSLAESATYLGVNGHLATLTSAAEHNWAWENLNHPFRYYLGASDRDSEGTWKWVTGEAWSYTNWYVGEPNNAAGWYEEDALSFYHGGLWNDLPDTHDLIVDNPNYRYIYGYVIEYDIAVPETAPLVSMPLGMFFIYVFKKFKRPAA